MPGDLQLILGVILLWHALGDCGCSGGVFGESYASRGLG